MGGNMIRQRLGGSVVGTTARSSFANEEPLAESLGKRFIKGVKRAICSFSLSFALGAGLASGGCTENDNRIPLPNTVVTQAALTDEDGHVSFNVRGNIFELNLSDSETGDAPPNLLVVLSAKNEGGLYYVTDPEEVFSTSIFGTTPATGIVEEEEPTIVSNVVVERRENVCNAPARFLVSGMTPAGLFNEAQPGVSDSILQKIFYPVMDGDGERARFPLSHIDDAIKQTTELLVGEAISRGAETGAVIVNVHFALKISQRTFESASAVGNLLLLADACRASDTLAWADYYRGLCYEDEDEFEIWTFLGFNNLAATIPLVDLEISALTNPVILILPVENPDHQAITEDGQWFAPTASIQGNVERIEANPLIRTVILEHSEGLLPSVQYSIPNRQDAESFFFVAGACGNYSPSYRLRAEVNNPYPVPYTASLSTNLSVSQDDQFSVTFLPERECTDSDYLTYYAEADGQCNPFDITISCSEVPGYPASCSNRTWSRTYEADYFSSAIQAQDGSFLAAGSKNGAFHVSRISRSGAVLWEHTLETSRHGRNFASAVLETEDSIVAFGSREQEDSPVCCPSYDGYLTSLSLAGGVQWEKTFDSVFIRAAISLDDGYLMAGSDDDGILLLKTDLSGEEIWRRSLNPGGGSAMANAVAAYDGGFLVSGVSQIGSEMYNMLIRTDSEGAELWSGDFGQSASDRFMISSLTDGSFALAGADSDGNGLLVKISSSGSPIWQNTFNGTPFRAVSGTSDGGFILTGDNDGQIWLLRLDINGDQVWEQEYGGPNSDYGASVIQLSDGFLLSGQTELGQYVARLIRTGEEGEI